MFGLVAAECAGGVPVLPAHSAATKAGHLGHSDNLDSSQNRRRRAASRVFADFDGLAFLSNQRCSQFVLLCLSTH